MADGAQTERAMAIIRVELQKVLPRYQCHKVVGAAKITQILPQESHAAVLWLGTGATTMEYAVSEAWMIRHKPVEDGYLVVYEDGYTSFSPAQAFEEGYSRLPEGASPGV